MEATIAGPLFGWPGLICGVFPLLFNGVWLTLVLTRLLFHLNLYPILFPLSYVAFYSPFAAIICGWLARQLKEYQKGNIAIVLGLIDIVLFLSTMMYPL